MPSPRPRTYDLANDDDLRDGQAFTEIAELIALEEAGRPLCFAAIFAGVTSREDFLKGLTAPFSKLAAQQNAFANRRVPFIGVFFDAAPRKGSIPFRVRIQVREISSAEFVHPPERCLAQQLWASHTHAYFATPPHQLQLFIASMAASLLKGYLPIQVATDEIAEWIMYNAGDYGPAASAIPAATVSVGFAADGFEPWDEEIMSTMERGMVPEDAWTFMHDLQKSRVEEHLQKHFRDFDDDPLMRAYRPHARASAYIPRPLRWSLAASEASESS